MSFSVKFDKRYESRANRVDFNSETNRRLSYRRGTRVFGALDERRRGFVEHACLYYKRDLPMVDETRISEAWQHFQKYRLIC